MEMILFCIVMLLIPFVVKGYYSFLKKINFELKGFELILYEIAVIFSIILTLNDITMFVLFCVLIAIAMYYIIRMLKKKEYINIYVIACYVVLSIINVIVAANICDKMHTGWCFCGLLYLLIAFVVPIYVLLLNGITFIIRKIKKIESKETVKINKGIIVVLFVIIILFACCGLVVVK